MDGGRRWWEPEPTTPERGAPKSRYWRGPEADHGKRHITGVRAEESRIRALAQHRWGDFSQRACRPIGTWKATDVFAFLARHDLPIHPSCAMSYGGALDRRWLRVAPIGGIPGADKQRADWEAAYYADVIRDGRAAQSYPGVTP